MKIITSTVKKWPGTVTLHDPLTIPQVLTLETAIVAANSLGEGATRTAADAAILPGLLACVERFDLAGLPAQIGAETFPGTPRRSSAELIAWLTKEIMRLYAEANDVPFE